MKLKKINSSWIEYKKKEVWFWDKLENEEKLGFLGEFLMDKYSVKTMAGFFRVAGWLRRVIK